MLRHNRLSGASQQRYQRSASRQLIRQLRHLLPCRHQVSRDSRATNASAREQRSVLLLFSLLLYPDRHRAGWSRRRSPAAARLRHRGGAVDRWNRRRSFLLPDQRWSVGRLPVRVRHRRVGRNAPAVVAAQSPVRSARSDVRLGTADAADVTSPGPVTRSGGGARLGTYRRRSFDPDGCGLREK